MRKYLLLALLGLIITGCSKNAPITPVVPVEGPTSSYNVAYPSDFRNGTWGEGHSTVTSSEVKIGNKAASSDYDANTKTTLDLYFNADGTADGYFFNTKDKLVSGIHATLPTANLTQMTANFSILVEAYDAKYGSGTIDFTNMVGNYFTSRTKITLSEAPLNDGTNDYYFLTDFDPQNTSETALVSKSHLIQMSKRMRSL